ncbi:cation-translocating P-type ATPase [Clostridium paraputrificum]|uniref:cation-translocating P-type ATPase n=1 Tax=Clostridium TaxID=1485 RepID=UPI0018A96441|nr:MULTISPECIES: cation-translocating P-type ATPase [Clostridium]MBS7130412.1 cation-translocating P-type ATPase [Clostridium sp.]MDB2075843.1 cation-translocating P-type ATPase [Clostridium paraputrificum]MDB2078793.1 cation-translocating P-type ATPase [Clostridium paraputrificum]MDB2086575.1 cation-translocating P-type ATPase [Clostridium paraputrificum]MDB2100085.1 cation-translocating P-type ATPase [Clostridium paraputrificum]
MDKFFSKSATDVLHHFNVTKEGLSTEQVNKSREENGFNELTEKKKKSVLVVFLEQFKDLLVGILIVAALISMATGDAESTLVIFAVIIMNAILGTVQNVKAEQSLNSLKALSSPNAKVIRNGVKIEIPSREVVPGDIVVLEAGDLVVADGRIIESFSLQVNESALTGESESVNKFEDVIDSEEVALGDQKNMVFSSSLVTYGRALIVVTNTGMTTELGKIATLMEQTKEKKTPLQITLDDFSKKLATIILIICIIVFGLSVYRQTPVLESLMFAVALAVAAIPEALSSIVTIVLALGTQKMAKENAIIKNIKSVEGLGCVSIICSDKTGTLTQNKMTTKQIFVDNSLIESEDIKFNDNLVQKELMRAAILCNDSTSVDGKEIGDPTEVALVNLGHVHSLKEQDVRDEFKRLKEIPFDSDRKLMSTLHYIDNKYVMYTKGALDVLLDRTTHIRTSEGVKKITQSDKDRILNTNQYLSENGLRVLSFAYKELDSEKELSLDDENNYTFLGLISMIDPPRVESAEAVKDCIMAGIKPIMITGDHKITASAIAKQIGILQEGDMAVTGLELDKMSDEELNEKLSHISVYARVSPENKIRIVDAWQNKEKIVAMTGDGVNDAPALKQADIGIAMGITGTEVSKDAASMILTDDNFATIVKSITNGRNVYRNIKNSIKFLLSGNMSGIIAVLYASIMALPVPFKAVHLLFINLLTDSLPAIAIGMEKSNKDLLKDKPRDSKESILTKDFMIEIAFEGLLIALFTIIAFHIGLSTGNKEVASTMAFSTLCLARLFHGFNCRGKKSVFALGVFSNKFSWYAFGAGLVFLNAVLFIPPLQNLFQVASLSGSLVLAIYLLAFFPTLIIQVYKVFAKDNDRSEEKNAEKNLSI